MAFPADLANQLVSTNTSITKLDSLIKAFKKNPVPGQLNQDCAPIKVLTTGLEEIKQNLAKLTASIGEKNDHIDAIVIRIQCTEKKMQKLFLEDTLPELLLNSSSPPKGVVYFNEQNVLTSCFGNSFPCKIEFSERHYQNAEAVFQAQKYTDQEKVRVHFETASAEKAVEFGGFFKMTEGRSKEWESDTVKIDAMMHVLRAKFRQNPPLLDKLMATGKDYLANHQPEPGLGDKFWGDGFDGTGKNMLGICLMQLRGECRGTGVVEKSRDTELFYQFCQKKWEKKCDKQFSNISSYYPSSPSSSSSLPSPLVERSANAAQPAITNLQQFQAQSSLQTKCIICKTEPKYINTIGKTFDYCCGMFCDKFRGSNQ